MAHLEQQRRAAAGFDPEPPEGSQLTADSPSGSVKKRSLPIGTSADIEIRGERLQPTLKDDLEGSFIPPLQPEEEASFTLDALEEGVWDTWITDNVLAFWDPNGPVPVYVSRNVGSGEFYTYPSLGGPFSSLEDVTSAVVSPRGSRIVDMSAELSKLSPSERLAHERLYCPDGTIRLYTRGELSGIENKKLHTLVQALLDKYNSNRNFEDRVGELEGIVHWQSIAEGFGKWYYHLNIRLKTKVATDDAGSANLFFAEVARDQMRHTLGYYLTTLCRVQSKDDDEAVCHGCRNNGSTDMKHPPLFCGFRGGHQDTYFPSGFGPCNENQWRDSDKNEAMNQEMKKAKIKQMYKHLGDADYMESLRQKRLHNPIAGTMEMVQDMIRLRGS